MFSIEVTFPIAAIILLGAYLRKIDWVSDDFAKTGSKLVFNITLPCLLFFNIADDDLTTNFPVHLILYSALGTTLAFLVFHFLAYFIKTPLSRGVFVQGSCRSNVAIVGIAICINAFGSDVLSIVSVYLSIIVILYNVYSVLTLIYHHEQVPSSTEVVKSVVTNPLAIAVFFAIIFSLLNIKVPSLLVDTGNKISQMTLPLALICAGASIRLQEFKTSKILYYAMANKLILIPLVATVICYFLGLRGEELGVLYIMTAAPTAAVSYTMVRSIGGDYYLASAIIAGTTVLSIFTMTLGLFLLRYYQWF